MCIPLPHFGEGLRNWYEDLQKTKEATHGIEKWAGWILYALTILLLSQWIHIGWGTREKAPSNGIDAYVVVAFGLTSLIYVFPSVPAAFVSTYFSISTVIVLLNTVLLRHVWGEPESPRRSLVLFMLNVPQVIVMFATWYYLGGQDKALLNSTLTFATISYVSDMPGTAMAQIATNFVLLAIFLASLVSEMWSRNPRR
jgi:hypothetical protein